MRPVIEIGLVGVVLVGLAGCFLWLASLSRRLGARPSLERMVEAIPEGEVKDALRLLFTRQQDLRQRVDRLEAFLEQVEQARAECLRRVRLVRYDAFPGVAGHNSFSLALLDDSLNGLVLTGIASRSDFRAYCKPVKSGRSEVALSPEEEQVLKLAAGGKEAGDAGQGGATSPRL